MIETHWNSQAVKERCLELVNERRSFTVDFNGATWLITIVPQEDPS